MLSKLKANPVLLAIVAVGVLVRLGVAFYLGNNVQALPGISDQISYHTLALRVYEGHGFSFGTGWWPATPAGEPTAHWSYLYVGFLVSLYSVFGPHAIAARIVQALACGILHPWLSFRIGTRIFGKRTGLISAALAALNGYFVYYSGALMTEALFFVAILWVIDISTSAAGETSAKRWAMLGLALAAGVMFRQVFLLLVPVILAWAGWQMMLHHNVSWPHAGKRVLISAALIGLCILPFTMRNYRVFHTFVLLNTNAGFAFFWANHPIHGTNFIPLLTSEQPTYGDLIPADVKQLNEGAMDRALLQRGIGFVLADPVRYARLSASRVTEYFRFWPSSGAGTLSNVVRVVSFGLCIPFLLTGLVAAFRTGTAHGPGTLILSLAALYTLLHLLSWTLIRYRLPVDAMLVPFTAFGMTVVYDRAALAIRGLRISPRSATA